MIKITLVCALAPREVFEQILDVPDGTTAQEAAAASALATQQTQQSAPDWKNLAPGIWGRAIEWAQVLKEGDRLELCRPLTVDPKTARRERFQQQGARGTGLFARRREGGKAGY
jgi:putative ubiquitin-RnfH superfamily antitoxin RatB of RatAB toxin-antitoxin module